ncbi:hypothetical protein Y1Q_0001484 [Alligator mississippiensis]|uniref:Uncharacterized protein n=1 Tax=Alligator mississippiensis TaxID=8496 RepID=A0A151M9L6_ALLMI|nr:hypothetical protein Y1Q_0001484 [Alligator mississippiensis]
MTESLLQDLLSTGKAVYTTGLTSCTTLSTECGHYMAFAILAVLSCRLCCEPKKEADMWVLHIIIGR